MKKLYIVPLMLVLAGFNSHAQSLQYQNATVYLQGNASGPELASYVHIVNISGNSLDVLAERTVNNLVGNQYSYFCWGTTCYPPTTDTALYEVTIPPGGTDTTFIGYLDPVGSQGTAKVTYCFYDMTNVQDSVCLEFVYDFTTGMDESGKSASFLSTPSPNPAARFTLISYRLANQVPESRLVISSAAGIPVRNILISGTQSAVLLNVADLAPGLYFYSLVSGNRVAGTRKLIVSTRN